MLAFLRSLFRCQHRHLSRVFAEPKPSKRKYVVCLRCGKHFLYDWQAMRIVEPIEVPGPLVPCPVEQARRSD
jgi:hypothetical protein